MKASGILIVAALILTASAADLRAQETPAAKAQKRHEELTARQSVDRLKETRKTLQSAIEKLEGGPAANEPPAASAAPAQPGIAVHGTAIQQAEQALQDVRRAIDELEVPEGQRQNVLDKLDEADSAMRMARQPDAESERRKLQEALQKVHKEIEVAQQTLPDVPSGDER